jgi:hypothetical protein
MAALPQVISMTGSVAAEKVDVKLTRGNNVNVGMESPNT